MIEQFKNDVLNGLSSNLKYLLSKYFYDEIGDQLFVQIMALPEYYLTRAELDIFKNKTSTLIEALGFEKGKSYDLIELGAGDGTKTFHLLKALVEGEYDVNYIPIDISQNALCKLEASLREKLPQLNISPRHGDYFGILEQINLDSKPKIILFLGSNIGNLTDERSAEFIYQLGSNLKKNEKVLLGVDLIKSKEIVLPAYDDAQGITAAFNLNLLERINKELGGNFKRENFVHQASYTEEEGICRSVLRSTKKQEVYISSLNRTFHFDENETIKTEISRKYNDEVIGQILDQTDFTITSKITDSQNLFADFVLTKRC